MQLKENIIYQDKGYSGILYDDSKEEFYETDYIGNCFLKYLLGDTMLIYTILDEYEIDKNTCINEINKFKEIMVNKGFISSE